MSAAVADGILVAMIVLAGAIGAYYVLRAIDWIKRWRETRAWRQRRKVIDRQLREKAREELRYELAKEKHR